MNNQQLIYLIEDLLTYGKELNWLEFKRGDATDNQRFGKYISGLANAANIAFEPYAYLIFGIDNETLSVVGTTFDYEKKKEKGSELDFYIRRNLSPSISYQHFICDYNDKKVVIFKIPAAGNLPVYFENEAHIRIASNLTELKKYPNYLRQILNSQIDWSAQIVENATMEDLDGNAVEIARRKFKEKSLNSPFYREIDNWTNEQILDKMRITVAGKITNTALILLGKPESSHLLSPRVAQITWKLDTEEKAYEHFSLPLFVEVNHLLSKIRNVTYKFFPDNQLVSIEVMKYDSEVILEALNNCIAHQDYWQNERIVVTEKINKLIFANGGGFFEGTADDYSNGEKTPRNYRNKWLAEAMVKLGMIDALGYGIHKMVKSQRDRYFPLPDYSHSSANEVILEIYGHSIDENYSKLLIEKKDELSLTEVILLDKIQKSQSITDDAANLLKKKKYIEGRKGSYYISAEISAITNKKAQYSKNKALDKQYYLDFILKAISDHGSLNRKEIDELLWKKLPDWMNDEQRENRISNLIKELRINGKITNKSSKKNPEWMLG
ncbi:MAG: putative DNA binding domain-containing protein [Candidatus Symbiothrix sp.]|jgi:ATP-dependent DNA helicase RecG|nr:putative DNA binding domain-containing protein [Candidatus Symbiothrix sp.]